MVAILPGILITSSSAFTKSNIYWMEAILKTYYFEFFRVTCSLFQLEKIYSVENATYYLHI